jgi:TonB family protein
VPPPAPAPEESTAPPAVESKVKAGDFVELWGVDVKPKQLNELRVDMPSAARQNRASGTIHVEVTIDETGQVTGAKVVKGLPSDFGLNRACEDAAMKLKYSPAISGGVPVKTKMTFPIHVR